MYLYRKSFRLHIQAHICGYMSHADAFGWLMVAPGGTPPEDVDAFHDLIFWDELVRSDRSWLQLRVCVCVHVPFFLANVINRVALDVEV